MKFTIDRRYWLRGEGGKNSVLYDSGREFKNMCCLGQIAEQCGISKLALNELRRPQSLNGEDKTLFESKFGIDMISLVDPGGTMYGTLGYLMLINDTSFIADARREMMLTDLVSHFYGHELEFIN